MHNYYTYYIFYDFIKENVDNDQISMTQNPQHITVQKTENLSKDDTRKAFLITSLSCNVLIIYY